MGLLVAIATMAVIASSGLIRSVRAQGIPPPLPTTYYGVASGAVANSTVFAYVVDGQSQIPCGEGSTILFEDSIVYVAKVSPDSSATPGCGSPGRQVLFKVRGPGEGASRSATQMAGWEVVGAGFVGVEFDIILDDPPTFVRQATAPGLSKTP